MDKLTSKQASTTEQARQYPEDKGSPTSDKNRTSQDFEDSERKLLCERGEGGEGGEGGEDGIPSMKKLTRSHRLVWGSGPKQSQCSYSSDFTPIASVNMVRKLVQICAHHATRKHNTHSLA